MSKLYPRYISPVSEENAGRLRKELNAGSIVSHFDDTKYGMVNTFFMTSNAFSLLPVMT